MASLNMDQVSTEPWFDKDAQVHQPIEALDKMDFGYCLLVKIKIPPKNGKDVWLVCMSSSKLAGAWADAFALANAEALKMADQGMNLIASIKNPWGGNLDITWGSKGARGGKYDESSDW